MPDEYKAHFQIHDVLTAFVDKKNKRECTTGFVLMQYWIASIVLWVVLGVTILWISCDAYFKKKVLPPILAYEASILYNIQKPVEEV